MSGSHYDYGFTHINRLKEEIQRDVKSREYIKVEDKYIYGLRMEMEDIVKQLRKLSNRCHDLEWYMSGDTGTEYLKKLKRRWG